MGKMSRSKGKRGELEVEKFVKAAGLECQRNIDGRFQEDADLRIAGAVAAEVRRRERLDIPGWSREHEAKCPSHLVPAIVFRRNNEPWRVSLPLEDFLDLLKEAGS